MAVCAFVDPTDHHRCIEKAKTRLLFIDPVNPQPIVKVACDRHGDMRFNSLSDSEKYVVKQKEQNQISYHDFSDKLNVVRWRRCRKCDHDFGFNDVIWILEFFSIKNEIQLRMRRSFRLHRDCAISELKLFTEKSNTQQNKSLDGF